MTVSNMYLICIFPPLTICSAQNISYQHTAPGKLCNLESSGSSLASGLHKLPGLRPVNRLRSASSHLQCSKCSSVNNSRLTSRNTSQISFRIDSKTAGQEAVTECPICLVDWARERMVTLVQCECQFCPDCLAQYVSLEILAGSYNISCPDPACPRSDWSTSGPPRCPGLLYESSFMP